MDRYDNLEQLGQKQSLLDALIEFEATLDRFHLYAFANWEDGEIVQGPELSRYWARVCLEYPYKKMPDPRGGTRLLKHGIKVEYEKTTKQTVTPPKTEKEQERQRKDGPVLHDVPVWRVWIDMPMRFIDGSVNIDTSVFSDEDSDTDMMNLDIPEPDARGGV